MNLWLPILTPLVPALWLMVVYNRFVRQRNRVREGWSEVQLKLRHNLLPNLVRVVQAYAAHEKLHWTKWRQREPNQSKPRNQGM